MTWTKISKRGKNGGRQKPRAPRSHEWNGSAPPREATNEGHGLRLAPKPLTSAAGFAQDVLRGVLQERAQ